VINVHDVPVATRRWERGKKKTKWDSRDLNMRSAFIHMLGDAAVSFGVLLSGTLNYVHRAGACYTRSSSFDRHRDFSEHRDCLRYSLHLKSLDCVPAASILAVMSYLPISGAWTDVHIGISGRSHTTSPDRPPGWCRSRRGRFVSIHHASPQAASTFINDHLQNRARPLRTRV